MSLQNLKIANFRNISTYNGEFSPYFNVISGENGSGKTSLLEAIYFIGHAKSFRTHMASQLIQHQVDNFTLFAKIINDNELISIGIERQSKQATRIKLDGQHCQSASELAMMLPIQVINPDSYKVLEAGPKYRRQFLDWGLFHVEQRFFTIWKRFQRALTQRNSALKAQLLTLEVTAWDAELSQCALQLDEFRQTYFDKLLSVLMPLFDNHSVLQQIECEYYRGWSAEVDFIDVLGSHLQRDRRLGYTTQGPQRADIKFQINNHPAEDVLSRGQQKILVSFLCLAQGMLCRDLCNKTCLYLVDDLPSELDEQHKLFLLNQLAALQSQVFITGVNPTELQALVVEHPHQMFHVEHGRIIVNDKDICQA